MIITPLNTFDEFLDKIKGIRAIGEEDDSYHSDMLFRGHQNSSWKLITTLERYSKKVFSIDEYHRSIHSVHPKFEAFSDKRIKIDSLHTSKNPTDSPLPPPPSYEFMVYLRHLGFPSPLLDWTSSPYIAAFFAYESAKSDKDVSIFAYREYVGSGKGWSEGEPVITSLGPNIYTHKRHFMQQAGYTICTNSRDSGDDIVYCSHESAFVKNHNYKQDVLIKYILPVSLKNSIIDMLNEMNINAFTLFSNEEGLAKSLALTAIK